MSRKPYKKYAKGKCLYCMFYVIDEDVLGDIKKGCLKGKTVRYIKKLRTACPDWKSKSTGRPKEFNYELNDEVKKQFSMVSTRFVRNELFKEFDIPPIEIGWIKNGKPLEFYIDVTGRKIRL